MCIHMIVVRGPPDSRLKRWQMQSAIKYMIGNQVYSIADVKHGILRGNQKAPFSMFRQFGDGDPRQGQVLPVFDPRVHFALVDGSSTSPRLFLYHSNSNLDQELSASAQVFCEDLVEFRVTDKTVLLPELLKEFLEDFQCSEVDLVRNHIATYCVGQQKADCESLKSSGEFSIEYVSRNWELNTWVPPN
eukprot:TRINITY_DN2147_c0_g2_i1.p1 TRINITY_DN2147_c0_g2~~TRINITY_DN2147_c0_g2_i1.p1  ORF type:complete len:189 (+),score=30.62 TRINITY_DN2147_c0_g2_i1:213-779(+)